MDDPYLYVLLVILICLSAFFSATETAFSSVSKMRLKHYASTGDKRAEKALSIIDRFDDALSAILIGNNIVNIASASIGTVIFTDLIGGKWGPGVSTLVMTLLVLCFGEILPKTYAKENAENVSIRVAGILSAIMTLFKPLIWVFVQIKRGVMKLFKSKENLPTVTEEELKYIIEEIEDEGVLEQHESELIQSALEFNDITVSEILTHRVDVVSVEVNEDIEAVKNIFLTERFSRLPVYDKNIDNVLGIISDKDFFREYLKNPKFNLNDIVQETLFVPPKKHISALLKELQRTKSQIAIVTDQYGGTLGIITLEDILEELVGEIWDEDEDIIQEFSQLSEDRYLVSGDMKVDDMVEQIAPEDIQQYEDNTSTVGGWVLDEIEHLPEAEEVCKIGRFQITVKEIEEQRIKQVEVVVLPELENEDENSR